MSKLTINESVRGFTDIIVLDYLDLIAIGNGLQRVIAQIPVGGAVTLAGVHKVTAAAGSTTVVFDIGTTLADPDEFINGLDADAMTDPVFNTGDAFTTGYMQAVKPLTTATDIVIEVNDAAVASLTAGKWVIGLNIVNLGQFA